MRPPRLRNFRIRGATAFARLLLVGLLLAGSVFAVDDELFRCWEKFASISRRIQAGDWTDPLHPTGRYLLGQRLLDRQKEKLSPEEFDRFYEWYFDHFFSDRWETLQDNLTSPDKFLHRSDRYDKEGQLPFAGYLAARAVLNAKALSKMTLAALDTAHKALLSWRSLPGARGWFSRLHLANSEGTSDSALGNVREGQVGFYPGESTARNLDGLRRSTTGEPINESPIDITNIHEVNPDLLYVPGSETSRPFVYYAPMSRWRQYADKLSPEIKVKLEAAEKKVENLDYRELAAEEAKALAAIQKAAREEFLTNWDKITTRHERGWITEEKRDQLVEAEGRRLKKQVEEAYAAQKKNLFFKTVRLDRPGEHNKLRTEFVAELFAHRWEQAKKDLKSAATKADAIDIVSDFYYDFVSIHPYKNGNGRMGRMLAEKLLGHYNIPPPLWTHLGEDVLLSRSDFKKLFHDAVDVSREFHQDLERLTEAGIPHTGVSVGFFAGQLDPKVASEHAIDADEFLAWVAAGTREHKKVEDAVKDFKTWRASQDYERGKGRGNRLVSALFGGSFGRTSNNQSSYDAKMERFYSPRGRVTRALEVTDVLTNEQLLDHFMIPQKATSPQTPLPMQQAFSNFNSALVRTPKLVERWPDGWFGGASSAQVAGIVPTYFEGNPPIERTRGAKTRVEITARRREVGTVDNGKTSEQIKAASSTQADRLVLHAGGIDPEAVVKVEANEVDSTHRRVAERLAFNRFEIREYRGNYLVGRTRYQRLKEGEWKTVASW